MIRICSFSILFVSLFICAGFSCTGETRLGKACTGKAVLGQKPQMRGIWGGIWLDGYRADTV